MTINNENNDDFAELLTREKMQEHAISRISKIEQEFTDGFRFLSNHPRSVTIFGSSQLPKDSKYMEQARSLGNRIVIELGYSVITGGGPGIMEAANQGASEAGGPSLGMTIKLPEHQPTNDDLTDSIDFHYFFSRKVCLAFSAEAYVFFPGGFGTFDELFEILTLVQTKKIAPVPIILVGTDFWKKFDDFVKTELLSRGTIAEEDVSLYTITDDEDKIIEIINLSPIFEGVPHDSSTPATDQM